MKKKLLTVISVLMMIFALVSLFPATAYADDALTVNGQSVNKGDVVTYEYYVGGVQKEVGGAGCYINYDKTFLEYVDGSIGFDIFNNAMHNIRTDEGSIYFSAVNAYGYDLKEERMIVTVSFKVLDTASGSTTVKCDFDEFFPNDDEMKDYTKDEYTDREVTTVNTYEKNMAPYLGTDADEMQNYMASEGFSTDDLFKGVPNENVPESERSNVSIPSLSEEPEENTSSGNTILVIIIVVFCVTAVGAATFVVLKRKKK